MCVLSVIFNAQYIFKWYCTLFSSCCLASGCWMLTVGIAVVEKSFNFPLTKSYEVEFVIYRLIHDAHTSTPTIRCCCAFKILQALWITDSFLLLCFVFEQFLFIIIYHYLCAPIQIISRPTAWCFFNLYHTKTEWKTYAHKTDKERRKKKINHHSIETACTYTTTAITTLISLIL